MDITETLTPKSDQLNAEDLLAGPRTVTVEKVSKGSAEQPVDIHLTEFPGRPFRPSKTVRRLIVAAWGPESSAYTGRRMLLYRDPTVKFGGMDVGGIRVSHMSHLDKTLKVALTVTRGKRAFFVVEPLQDGPPAITPEIAGDFERRITEAVSLDELGAIGADLKAWDLGSHKQQLQSAWKDRQSAIKSAPAAEPEPAPADSGPATPKQLSQLAQLRSAEGYDGDDQGWFIVLSGISGHPIGADGDITEADAAAILAEYQREDEK